MRTYQKALPQYPQAFGPAVLTQDPSFLDIAGQIGGIAAGFIPGTNPSDTAAKTPFVAPQQAPIFVDTRNPNIAAKIGSR